ncbi:conjugative transfer signal peptidase TraF [Deltaproteobacteria bacterium OttesenSCG-928-M10]|nr:conjugative transfer signal peptidase TraF [Deltaproteobacteria bacterium OttesenSCG-928-M10]
MIIALVYGLGFSIYYFIGPNTSNWPLLIGGAMAAYVALYALDVVGFRFNFTPSMSKGIYVMQPAAEKPQRGDLVTFCLELNNPFTAVARERDYIGSGTCPSGLKPFLKTLAGLPGDQVEVSPDGIILNGSYLSGTARPEYDSQGRLVPSSLLKDGPIPEGQALVVSQQHSSSFDSRHFGLLPYDSLTKVEPVFTESITPQREAKDAASN